jgi:transposase
MKHFNLKQKGPDTLLVLKEQFINNFKHGRMQVTAIATVLMIAITTAYDWSHTYLLYGKDALLSRNKPGPAAGEAGQEKTGRLLNTGQEKDIQRHLTNYKPTDPESGQLNSAVWDRKTIIALIEHLFGIEMSRGTVGRYLKLWGFTPKKPAKKAHEQNPKAVKDFKEVTFKQLKDKCSKENGVIVVLDETGVHSSTYIGKSYSPRGKRCTSDLSSQKFRKNIIISSSLEGQLNYMTYDNSMNSQRYIIFLNRLLKQYNGQKIFLLADNMRVHHAKILKEWAIDKDKLIEFCYFPSYSPELNPIEYINGYIKVQMFTQRPVRSKNDLEERIRSVLRPLQKRPQEVKRFFYHPELDYMKYT